MQEYIEHSEQVYKLYAIGPNYYGSEIRHSIPHEEITLSGDHGFRFDSQHKFKPEQFKQYSQVSRLDQAKTADFIKQFTAKFQMMLFGIDVIITKDGRHLVIDCNYFSSYNGLEV